MAKAMLRQTEIEVVVIEKKDDGVILELTQEEAEVLSVILGNVCGVGDARDISGNIFQLLSDLGINYRKSSKKYVVHPDHGEMEFVDKKHLGSCDGSYG